MTNDNLYRHTRLQELGNSDYEITEEQSDIRKWRVTDEQDRKIGTVHDLLFDSQSEKVRYLIIDLGNNELNLDARRVLIPIGIARIHEENDQVILPGVTAVKVNALPDYIPGEVNPGVENMVRHTLSEGSDIGEGLTGHPLTNEDEDFYSHRHFNEDAFYQPRKDRVGSVLTVIGLFDDSMEAENAVRDLVINGFSQHNIDLSSSNLTETALNAQDPADLTTGITNFINVSTSDETEEQESVTGGSVITVKCLSEEEVRRAMNILDKCGAVEVSENT